MLVSKQDTRLLFKMDSILAYSLSICVSMFRLLVGSILVKLSCIYFGYSTFQLGVASSEMSFVFSLGTVWGCAGKRCISPPWLLSGDDQN